jgi:hypothetical protein
MPAILWFLVVVGAAAAEPLGPGMPLPSLNLADQHDVPVAVDVNTRLVIFARDMDAAEIVEEALATDGAALLAGAGAVFVSDIHRMPSLITRMFALPSMRKRPYRMALDREGTATADLPAREERVSLIRVDQLKIEKIDFVGDAAQLRAALQAAAAPPGSTGRPPAE